MRPFRRALATAAVSSAFVVTAGVALPASSTEGKSTPPVIEEVAEGRQRGSVRVDVGGPAQVNYRKITLPPGASTGRHCHYGQVIGVVKSGRLTHYAPVHPGGVRTYRAGQSIVEGSGYVHEGRNEGKRDVVLWVTYVTPEGKPLAEPDLSRCEASLA
ncbi:cupin domain-containing protein [Streptomyces sp. NPDC041068]|uniref:cupin domain-containing protein n=1 Tax=Streptomyces sp. NPDC041068 TaxID=3155130 RepID=UPI0033DEDA8E